MKTKKGPFKMKGFTYPGKSPVKNIATARNSRINPDAVLLEAAGMMSKEKPTSIGGEAALGFLEGMAAVKPVKAEVVEKNKKKKEKEKKKKKKKKGPGLLNKMINFAINPKF